MRGHIANASRPQLSREHGPRPPLRSEGRGLFARSVRIPPDRVRPTRTPRRHLIGRVGRAFYSTKSSALRGVILLPYVLSELRFRAWSAASLACFKGSSAVNAAGGRAKPTAGRAFAATCRAAPFLPRRTKGGASKVQRQGRATRQLQSPGHPPIPRIVPPGLPRGPAVVTSEKNGEFVVSSANRI